MHGRSRKSVLVVLVVIMKIAWLNLGSIVPTIHFQMRFLITGRMGQSLPNSKTGHEKGWLRCSAIKLTV